MTTPAAPPDPLYGTLIAAQTLLDSTLRFIETSMKPETFGLWTVRHNLQDARDLVAQAAADLADRDRT